MSERDCWTMAGLTAVISPVKTWPGNASTVAVTFWPRDTWPVSMPGTTSCSRNGSTLRSLMHRRRGLDVLSDRHVTRADEPRKRGADHDIRNGLLRQRQLRLCLGERRARGRDILLRRLGLRLRLIGHLARQVASRDQPLVALRRSSAPMCSATRPAERWPRPATPPLSPRPAAVRRPRREAARAPYPASRTGRRPRVWRPRGRMTPGRRRSPRPRRSCRWPEASRARPVRSRAPCAPPRWTASGLWRRPARPRGDIRAERARARSTRVRARRWQEIRGIVGTLKSMAGFKD